MSDESDVDIKFGADVEGVGEGAKEAEGRIAELVEHIKEFGEQTREANEKAAESFKELGEHTNEVKEHLLELAEVFGIAFSLDALKEFIEQNAELGEELERTAAKLGITGEQASGLQGIARLTGTSFDGLQTAMERLQVGLATVDEKSSRTGNALRALGINAQEMRAASIAQQINILSEAVSKFQDGATKTAAVQALGRSFVEMLPLLDRGKEGLDDLNSTLDATGAKMTNEMVEAFAHTNEDLNTMKLAVQGVSERIFSALNPSIDASAVKITHFIESFKDTDIKSWVASVLADLGEFEIKATALFQDVIDTVNALISTLDRMYHAIPTNKELLDKVGLHPYGPMEGTPGAAGTPPAAGPFGAIEPVGDTSLSQKIKDNAFGAAEAIEQLRNAAKITAEDLHDRPPLGGGEGGKPKVPQMQLGGAGGKQDDPVKDAAEDAAHWIKIWTDAAGQQEAMLDGELKRHEISTAQWLAGTKDALADELQDTIATYQAEIAAANLKGQALKAVNDKIAEAEAANALKVTKAEQKAADETTKSWMTVADEIAGIMNSQVNSLLRGTESIGTAFKNMAASAIEALAQLAVKIAVDAALMEALSLATGGAAGGFGSGGFGSWLGSMLHFDEGTDYVQQTGPAIIHQGEMVVPADQNPNNPANRGGGGGGDTFHAHNNIGGIHINTGGREVDPAMIAKAVNKAFGNGDHFGLKNLRGSGRK